MRIPSWPWNRVDYTDLKGKRSTYFCVQGTSIKSVQYHAWLETGL